MARHERVARREAVRSAEVLVALPLPSMNHMGRMHRLHPARPGEGIGGHPRKEPRLAGGVHQVAGGFDGVQGFAQTHDARVGAIVAHEPSVEFGEALGIEDAASTSIERAVCLEGHHALYDDLLGAGPLLQGPRAPCQRGAEPVFVGTGVRIGDVPCPPVKDEQRTLASFGYGVNSHSILAHRRFSEMQSKGLLNRARWVSLALLVCLLVVPDVWGQVEISRPFFRTYTIDDGMSQNMVISVVQDSLGFLWMGTKDGLNRFDGQRFRLYGADPSNPRTFRNGYILQVAIDHDGTLWVSTLNGDLHRYHPETDDFSLVKTDLPNLLSVVGDSSTGWWIGSAAGIHFMEPRTFSTSRYTVNVRNQPTFIVPGPTPLAAQESGVYTLPRTPADGAARPLLQRPWDALGLRGIVLDPSHQLWVATEVGLYVLSVRSGNWVKDPYFRGKVVQGLTYLKQSDEIFLQTHTSVYFLRPRDRQRVRSIPLAFGMSYFEDRSGQIWIGTAGFGLLHFDPRRPRFGFREATLSEAVFGDMLPLLNQRTGRLIGVGDFEVTGIHQRSERPHIFTMAIRYGEVWELDTIGKRLTQLTPNRNTDAFPVTNITALARSGDTLWIGHDKTLALYRISTRTYEPFAWPTPPPDIHPLFYRFLHEAYSSLHIDPTGCVWIGTSYNGLYQHCPHTQETLHYSAQPNQPGELRNSFVLSLADDPLEPLRYLWVGTDGGGLYRFDRTTQHFLWINEVAQLPNRVIYKILRGNDSHLWISTNRGLLRVNPLTLHVQQFTARDGLQGNEFDRRKGFATPDGILTFCGLAGCNQFSPRDIGINPFVPRTVITQIRALNEPLDTPLPHWLTERITLPYRSSTLVSFTLAALEFSDPGRNVFRYRLRGFSSDWATLDDGSTLTFTNLDPGTYTLEVMASNNDGVWASPEDLLELTITPPWWGTLWFRLFALLAVIGVAGGSTALSAQMKYSRQLEEASRKAELDKERLRISRDMHDALGSRLTQIKYMANLGEEADLTEIGDVTTEVMHQLNEIVWSVNPENDVLDQLAEYLAEYAERATQSIGMRCRLHMDPHFPALPIAAELRHNIVMVVREAIQNSIKHARSAELHLEIHYAGDQFEVTLRDAGVGFDLATLPKRGQGLRTMQARMVPHKGQVVVQSAPTKGTIVAVRVPIPKE